VYIPITHTSRDTYTLQTTRQHPNAARPHISHNTCITKCTHHIHHATHHIHHTTHHIHHTTHDTHTSDHNQTFKCSSSTSVTDNTYITKHFTHNTKSFAYTCRLTYYTYWHNTTNSPADPPHSSHYMHGMCITKIQTPYTLPSPHYMYVK